MRGLAHGLEPVVLIGNAGLTPAVLKEIDASLKAHELIKVKAGGAEREDRVAWLAQICETLDAQPVQHIGKILVIYRENTDKPEPAPARRAPAKGKRAARSGSGARPASARSGKPAPRARTESGPGAGGSARPASPGRLRAAAKPRGSAATGNTARPRGKSTRRP